MSWLRTSRFVCHQICKRSPLSVTKSLQKSLPISIQHDFHVLSLGANMTNSRFVATKAAPETSAGRSPVDSSSRSEVVMHSVNLLVQRSGRVLLSDVLGMIIIMYCSKQIILML
jgi:hypothetical protein